jgi:26S proteasome regulatory subunit T2
MKVCWFYIDEIDAIGTKRYDANSGGEREIQRTMLELLNQLDGFDSMSEVKVRYFSGF